jgi:TDG/mug DNA glycosylase family protein
MNKTKCWPPKLSQNARILFVGINPHPGSYQRGVPFSNNKMLWYLLNQAGLINEPLEKLKTDNSLKEIYETKILSVYRLNFISMVDRPTIDATSLKKGEEEAGVRRLLKVIEIYTPKVVCFIGRNTYALFKKHHSFVYGWQESIGKSKVYLMHFPIRGLASIRLKELIEIRNSLS